VRSRGGGEDTTFEAKDRVAEDRLPQGQGLENTFENTHKYKCKHCNYEFIEVFKSKIV